MGPRPLASGPACRRLVSAEQRVMAGVLVYTVLCRVQRSRAFMRVCQKACLAADSLGRLLLQV